MLLTKEELLDGAKKSLENAKELIEEGNLLFDKGKYARAFTLFQLSIEEVGKSSLIFESILFDRYKSAGQQKVLLDQLRSHKNKTKVAQRIDLLLAMAIKNKETKKALVNNYAKQSEQIDKINEFKNFSLYVSLIENKFIKPSEKITKSLVEDYKFYAEIRCEATRQFNEALLNNLNEIVKRFAEINPEDLLKNPPQEIKELIDMVENN